MSTLRPLVSLVTVLALSACQGDGAGGSGEGASYEVNLRPLVPENQEDLFGEVSSVTLVVEPEVGAPSEYELTNVGSNDFDQVTELPALEDVTLALVGRGAEDQVVAFGRSERFSISEGTLDVPVLVGETDKLGWLDTMPEALSGGAIVSDAAGRFLVIGGSNKSPNSASGASASILSFLAAPPNEGLSFEIVGTMPENEDSGEGRVGHVAAMLEGSHGDAGKVFIAGGSSGYGNCQDATDSVLLFDPETGTFEDLSDDRDARLDSQRFLMRAAVDTSGQVIMAGGATSCSGGDLTPSEMVHFYSPSSRTNDAEAIDYLGDWPTWMPSLAALGTEGVIICGGVDFEDDFGAYALSEQCHTMTVGQELISNDFELPGGQGMAWHNMVTLDDGRVLFTGGFRETNPSIVDGEVLDASDQAFIYDGSSWQEVGSMHNARAMHASALLPDGRVLVVGGVSQANDLFNFDSNDGLACAEIFDPSTGAFVEVDDCDSNSSTSSLRTRTAHPMVGADALYGVLVVGGVGVDSSPLADAALFISESISR